MITTTDTRFLDMRATAKYLGKTYRWMQRNYIDLIRNGVRVCRMPRSSKRGHIIFEKQSLDRYIQRCQIGDHLLDILSDQRSNPKD